MKKIALWKMVLLSIVTLTVYELYWYSVQRNTLAKKTKKQLPRNWWLAVAYIGTWLLSFAYITAVAMTNDAGVIFALTAAWILLVLGFVVMRYVWIIKFLIVAAKQVTPRVTLGWLIVHLFLVSVSVIFIIQHYVNRKPTAKQTKPSRTFVVWSIIVIILLQGGSTAAFLAVEMPTIQSDINETQELLDLSQQTHLLDKKYNGCIDTLDSDFPTVTTDNEAAYLEGWDACEAIRIEQNKAVDDYNALYKELNP